jgi:hypothetical protein
MNFMHWITLGAGAWMMGGVGLLAYHYPAGIPEANHWQAAVVLAPMLIPVALLGWLLWNIR